MITTFKKYLGLTILALVLTVSLAGWTVDAYASRFDEVLDGDYTVSLYKTEARGLTIMGKTISRQVPMETPYFVETFKVKANKITINGQEAPIFDNPACKLSIALKAIFMCTTSEGDWLVAVRQRAATDPDWYK